MPEETIVQSIYCLCNRVWDNKAMHTLIDTILQQRDPFEKLALERHISGEGQRKIQLNTRSITGKAGEAQMILLSMEVIDDN